METTVPVLLVRLHTNTVLYWSHHSVEGTEVHKQPLTVSGNARQIELYKRKQK